MHACTDSDAFFNFKLVKFINHFVVTRKTSNDKITQINFLDIFGQKQSLNKKKWEVVKVKLGIMKSH